LTPNDHPWFYSAVRFSLASLELSRCSRVLASAGASLAAAAVWLVAAEAAAEQAHPAAPAASAPDPAPKDELGPALERADVPAAVAEPAPAAAPPPASSPVRGQGDERELPDYDGRPEATTAGDVLLWVPRVVLFPLYVVSEYVLRLPIGWLVTSAEREKWPALFIDFFTFNNRQGGVVPTFLIDLGLRPSVGVYAFWNDFIAEQNDLRLRATWGGSGFWQLRIADRLTIGEGQLTLAAAYDTRPDNVFYGIGRYQQDERSRYGSSISRLDLSYRQPFFRSSYVRGIGELRQVELNGDPSCCRNDPTVNELVSQGAFDSPPGMDQLYDVAGLTAELVLDSRYQRLPEDLELASDHVTPPGSGFRLGFRGRVISLLDQTLASSEPLADAWTNYGASLGGYLDLNGMQRNVSVTAIVDFVDPIGGGDVPLLDLVSLGGERPLRGFLANRFVDRSGAVLRFEYRWPIAVWLDGSLLYEMGNVFGEHLEGFDVAEFRSSYGFGMAAVGPSDHPFQALVAFGTEPYDSGGRIDSFRFVFGTTAGF
jgi:hypothetical protein